MPWEVVGVLLIGGLVAAPIAAWIVPPQRARARDGCRRVHPARQANTFLEAIGLDPALNVFVYGAILAVWITALYFALHAPSGQAQAGDRDPGVEREERSLLARPAGVQPRPDSSLEALRV